MIARTVMENSNSGVMQEGVSADELATTAVHQDTAAADDFVVIAGLASADPRPTLLSGASPSAQTTPKPLQSASDWAMPSGDDWARKYSPASLISRENVSNLKLLHQFDAAAAFGEPWRTTTTESPPLSSGGLVYWISAGDYLVATHLVSGEKAWHLKLPTRGSSRRGFLLRERGDGLNPVLYVPFGPFVAAVDATNGKLLRSFADGGVLRLPNPTIMAPAIYGDELIVGTYDPPWIVGVDLASGEAKWTLPLHDDERNFKGGALWSSGMAVDRARGLLFVTTGNPRPALSGMTRPGDNQNSNSVIAIDLNRREIKWVFQEVKHDLWDFDIPAGPMLSSIDVAGQSFDVVIAVTKIGNTLVLERESGQPIFDYRLGRAPPSSFVHEQTARRQPRLEKPEPLIGIEFDRTMITDVSAESRAFASRQINDGRTVFGWFEPPALNKDLLTFGMHGGAIWHGASIDSLNGMLYVAVNQIPWFLRVYLTTMFAQDPPIHAANQVYAQKCQSCHLHSGDGQFVTRGEAAINFVPSLHGYTLDESNRASFQADLFSSVHDGVIVTQDELDSIWEFFGLWDRALLDSEALQLTFHWRQFLDQDGRPASKPPWAKIVALDLRSGDKAWEVPFGEEMIDGDVSETGSPAYGGLVATAGGVIFATGTDDGYIRALDQATGETLWRYEMSAAGSAPPITVEFEGKQYLCVIATGGKFHNFVNKASKLYVFAL